MHVVPTLTGQSTILVHVAVPDLFAGPGLQEVVCICPTAGFSMLQHIHQHLHQLVSCQAIDNREKGWSDIHKKSGVMKYIHVHTYVYMYTVSCVLSWSYTSLEKCNNILC